MKEERRACRWHEVEIVEDVKKVPVKLFHVRNYF